MNKELGKLHRDFYKIISYSSLIRWISLYDSAISFEEYSSLCEIFDFIRQSPSIMMSATSLFGAECPQVS